MKRFLTILFLLVFSMNTAMAEFVTIESNVTMENFWEKNGREQQKVLLISSKIINANKLKKRIPVVLDRNLNTINAYANSWDRKVHIYTGLLYYIDNDDEMAFILGHEMAHVLDYYDGIGKILGIVFNSKQYEYKADLISIDLMVKSGYNPIAALTEMNKWMGENMFDFGILTSHPLTSKRLMNVYKYIYVKYPWALTSDMTKNVNYQNFLNSSAKDIAIFKQKQEQKSIKNEGTDNL